MGHTSVSLSYFLGGWARWGGRGKGQGDTPVNGAFHEKNGFSSVKEGREGLSSACC